MAEPLKPTPLPYASPGAEPPPSNFVGCVLMVAGFVTPLAIAATLDRIGIRGPYVLIALVLPILPLAIPMFTRCIALGWLLAALFATCARTCLSTII